MDGAQSKQRIEWVDVLKGIAIISVIIGHRSGGAGLILPKVIKIWIYSWHIPLFFFLSGIVFSIDKYTNFMEFLIKKIKTILIPMVVFSLIRIIFYYVYYYFILGNDSYNEINMLKRFAGILIQLREAGYEGYLWFLNCLFLSQILLYTIIKLTKNISRYILIAISSAYVVSVLWIEIVGIQLPWYLETSLIAILFVGLGYLMKCYKDKILLNMNWIIILIALAINIVATYYNYLVLESNVDLVVDQIGNPILYLLESLSGIIVFIGVFKNVKKVKAISYIGKNSLVYYCLIDMMAFIPDIVIYNIMHLNYNVIGNAILLVWIGYVIIICISIYPINEFINKKVQVVLGKF